MEEPPARTCAQNSTDDGLAPEEEGHGRRRRSTKVVSEKYIEVLLVIDNSVVNFHGHSLVEQYLVTQMNLVSLSRDVT